MSNRVYATKEVSFENQDQSQLHSSLGDLKTIMNIPWGKQEFEVNTDKRP